MALVSDEYSDLVARCRDLAKVINQADRVVYQYEYFEATANGFRKSTNLNHEYGSSREEFERFKKEQDCTLEYAGKISVRKFYRKNSKNELILNGCVFEESLSTKAVISEYEEKFDILFESVCDAFEIIKRKEFLYYLQTNVGLEKSQFSSLVALIHKLEHIIEQISFDEEFEQLFIDLYR